MTNEASVSADIEKRHAARRDGVWSVCRSLLVPCVCGLAAGLVGQIPSSLPEIEGEWHSPYNWGFAPVPTINAIEVGVIPRGPYQGRVVFLTWSGGKKWGILNPEGINPNTLQPDPSWPQFVGTWTITAGDAYGRFPAWQYITCSGEAWTEDGRWFVAGGMDQTGYTSCPITPSTGKGSKYAWIYDPDVVLLGTGGPPQGDWYLQNVMAVERYYPTVIEDGYDFERGECIVAGGSIEAVGQQCATMNDNYEAFRPGARHWPPVDPATVPLTHQNVGQWQTHSGGQRLFPGPGVKTAGQGDFNWYPRLFLLPNGKMASIATEVQSAIAQHPVTASGDWSLLGLRTITGYRFYGAAVLYPNLSASYTNTVMNIGGEAGGTGAVTNVEWANAAMGGPGCWPNGYSWTQRDPLNTCGVDVEPPPLNVAREECTAVILPTGEILVLHNGAVGAPNYKRPELLSNGTWKLMAEETSKRPHHAIALLLPSGRVLSGSGGDAGTETREWDFQVFSPPYMYQNRPAWITTIGTLAARGQTNTAQISLPAGTTVGSVVMIRPGSLTHHADSNQRYVKLTLEDAPQGQVKFKSPNGPPGSGGTVIAPRGYWMLFLVTNTGVPSVAQFVYFS